VTPCSSAARERLGSRYNPSSGNPRLVGWTHTPREHAGFLFPGREIVPTQHDIREAGPLSTDDARVQAAPIRAHDDFLPFVRALARMVRRRLAAEQPPEDPPPDKAEGASPRPKGGAPLSSSTTTTTGCHTERKGNCYV
jgi:hypothetical protein